MSNINRHAPLKWAQRKDKVYTTIDIQDIHVDEVKIESQKLLFKGSSKGASYELEVELFDEVKPETSKWVARGRGVEILLMKAKTEDAWWPRLTKDKKKYPNINVDWSMYVDEDDSAGAADIDFGDMGGMPGMPGMGGMGGEGMGGMGEADLQKLLSKYKAQGAMAGGDACGCGDDKCSCEHDHQHEKEDSDDEDMPDLVK